MCVDTWRLTYDRLSVNAASPSSDARPDLYIFGGADAGGEVILLWEKPPVGNLQILNN